MNFTSSFCCHFPWDLYSSVRSQFSFRLENDQMILIMRYFCSAIDSDPFASKKRTVSRGGPMLVKHRHISPMLTKFYFDCISRGSKRSCPYYTTVRWDEAYIGIPLAIVHCFPSWPNVQIIRPEGARQKLTWKFSRYKRPYSKHSCCTAGRQKSIGSEA